MTLPKIDMAEVTRLTQQGRLNEAMALLQGQPIARSEDKAGTEHSGATIEMYPPSQGTGQAWTASFSASAAQAAKGSEAPPLSQIGRTVRRVARNVAMPGRGSNHPRALPVPAGARFEAHRFTNPAGSRDYKLYVPSGYTGQPVPLVVMLHGCTQSPDDFAAGTRMNEVAEEQIFLVAYPAQPQRANASKCWNWFNEGDQQRDGGEPSIIAGLTRQIMRDYAVAPEKVFVAGLSAGGAAAAVMGSAYPELYSAVGVHSGLPCGAAKDMPSAFAAMLNGSQTAQRKGALVRTIVFHGDGDKTVHPINGEQVILHAGNGRIGATTTTKGTAAGGLRYTRTIQTDAAGVPLTEHWVLHGAGHAWSGGSANGSYTEPRGPDASREMLRFFMT